MVQNASTKGWLVVDTGDKCPNVGEAYSVTSTGEGQNPGPMTRSVFSLQRVDASDMFGADEFVRFGQKVRVCSSEHLFRKTLHLASFTMTGAVKSPASERQPVAMHAVPLAETAWVIDSLDPNDRFEKQGEVVAANEPILLRHCHTNVLLATDAAVPLKNDFGTEFEVHCKNHSRNNLSQNLELESQGRLTSDVPSKY